MVGLLVCLMASAIEWEVVLKGKGHLLLALLWTTGVPGMIWLARRNRRATVVTALRAFLGLMVIGALAQPSLAALVAAGVTGVGLVILERLWRKKEEPPRSFHLTLRS